MAWDEVEVDDSLVINNVRNDVACDYNPSASSVIPIRVSTIAFSSTRSVIYLLIHITCFCTHSLNAKNSFAQISF